MKRRAVRWRALGRPGLEHVEMTEAEDRILARSVVIGEREGTASGLRYEVELGPDWTFRRLAVERMDGAALRLESDGRGGWLRDGPMRRNWRGAFTSTCRGRPSPIPCRSGGTG